MAGWVLGQAGLKSKSRKGLAALILAANMPDIDVFFGGFPWQALATHRGLTHGLVGGVLLMPPILFGLLWLLDRWQQRHDRQFKSGLPMRPGWLLALCYLGALTHPLLDLLTTYSVQLFSPLSDLWYHADGLFIIDLWLWLLLAGSIFWSKRREGRGLPGWRRPAHAAIGVTLLYIGMNLAVTERANAAVGQWAGSRPADAIFASPPPPLFWRTDLPFPFPWRRGLVWREGDCYRRSDFDPLAGGLGPVAACQPSNMRDPLVIKAIRQDAALRKFLHWSILPVASVERSACSAKVSIGDARYMDWGGRSRLMRESVVPTGGPGC